MQIFVVEDDLELCNIINLRLKREGYHVESCHNGQDALTYLLQYSYDLVILDRMLPGLDGVSIVKKLRNSGNYVPVIMVTALDGVTDRIDGLDSGADDYLVKPFAVSELTARVRALLRRPRSMEITNTVSFSDLLLNPFELTLTCKDKLLKLSKKESMLLEYLIINQNQTLTREQIIHRVWGESDIEEGSLDTYVYFLRRHLKSLQSKVSVITVHGLGYRLGETI
jgi:DNA-binding response OmpR family regulator